MEPQVGLGRRLKAKWRAFLCGILGHRWDWYLCRGDYGEPGADMCRRCDQVRPNYALPCRCVEFGGRCGCEAPGFVAE